MRIVFKKSTWLISMLCGFFFSLSGFSGSFKKLSFEKPLKISLQTRQFLKKTVYSQQQILKSDPSQGLMQAMLDINARILQTETITPADVQSVFAIVDQAKKRLFEQNNSLTFEAWFNFLINSLQFVQARGSQHDLGYLQKTLRKPIEHGTIARVVGICSDMLHHFDGVLMTEYDFLVLSNLVLALSFQNC